MKFCFIIATTLLVITVASAQHWEFERIDSSAGQMGLVSGYSRDGRLHAIYCDTNWNFRYAYRDTAWHAESAFTATARRWRAAVSARGRAAVLLQSDVYDTFDLYERTDSGWVMSRLPLSERGTADDHSFALDTLDRPLVGYYLEDIWGRFSKVAKRVSPDSWVVITLSSGGGLYEYPSGPCAMEVNFRNNHAVALHKYRYTRDATNTVYASVHFDSTIWRHATVAWRSGSAVNAYATAARNDSASTSCWSARRSGIDSFYCGGQLLRVSATSVSRASMRIDSLNQEHVVYARGSSTVYAHRTGGAWPQDRVPTREGDRLQGLELDAGDSPCAYFLDNAGVPMLARLSYAAIDVGTRWTVAPRDTINVGDSVVPAATVVNYGTTATSFTVLLELSTAYLDSSYVENLQPGDSARLTFGAWVPLDTGSTAVRCYTTLVGDQWPANDTVVKTVYVMTGSGLHGGAVLAPPQRPGPTISRTKLLTVHTTETLLDITGRLVMNLKPGPNDVSRLAPGVYFIVQQGSWGRGSEGSRRKVVIAR